MESIESISWLLNRVVMAEQISMKRETDYLSCMSDWWATFILSYVNTYDTRYIRGKLQAGVSPTKPIDPLAIITTEPA